MIECPRVAFALLIGLLTYLAIICETPAGDSAGAVVVRLGTLTPEVIQYVSQVAERRKLTLPSGTDLLSVIAEYCGSANARRTYLALFVAENAANTDISEGRFRTTEDAEFNLPGCIFAEEALAQVVTTSFGPQWQKPELIAADSAATAAILKGVRVDFEQLAGGSSVQRLSVTPNFETPSAIVTSMNVGRLRDQKVEQSLADLASYAIENADKMSTILAVPTEELSTYAQKYEKAVRTQDVLLLNDIDDFGNLPVGTGIAVPVFRPQTYSFALAPEYSAADVAKTISALALSSGGGPTAAAVGISDVSPYFAVPQSSGPAACNGETTDEWPYSVDEFRRVLRLRTLAAKPVLAGRTLILDTGFPTEEVDTKPFEERFFTPQRLAGEAPRRVWRGTRSGKEFFGELEDGGHGISVVTMALGGVSLLEGGGLSKDSAITINDGLIITISGYRPEGNQLALELETVSDTLGGENWSGTQPDVINLSLKFNVTEAHTGDRDTIVSSSNGGRLYVFAAGNANGTEPPSDLNAEEVSPASWGGPSGPNIITVASIDPDGSLSAFSNYGSNRVDIAAPGCRVPVYSWNKTSKKLVLQRLSGTSLSAPLVSFAANLLSIEYRNNMRGLKARLLGSGRYGQALVGKVHSQRSLDLPTALGTPFDIVRYRDGSIVYGTVYWPQSGWIVCGGKKAREALLQLNFEETGTINQASVSLNDGIMSAVRCPRTPSMLSALQFAEIDESADNLTFKDYKTLALDSVVSITLCTEQNCVQPPTASP